MNYFLCALDTIYIGIPAERTERIIPAARVQTTVFETEEEEAFISLPVLFRQKDTTAPHGVVLKAGGEHHAAGIVKKVLLTPRIDKDLEIPEENIHQLPEVLVGPLRFFRGAYFNGQSVILILNPEKLMESIR